jgi:hypothetical protein
MNSSLYMVGAALRQSGKVDLYYNYSYVCESETLFQDVEVTHSDIYLKTLGDKESVLTIKLQKEQVRLSFENSKVIGKVFKQEAFFSL